MSTNVIQIKQKSIDQPCKVSLFHPLLSLKLYCSHVEMPERYDINDVYEDEVNDGLEDVNYN